MKLLYPDWELHIELEENTVSVLVLENPKDMSEFVTDLVLSCENSSGKAVLSDKEKVLSFSKNAVLLLNPLLIDINTKEVVNKLYQEMATIASEKYSAQEQEVLAEILRFLDNIVNSVPYPVIFKPELSLRDLFKISEIKIDYEGSLSQRLAAQIQIMGTLTRTPLLIYVGLKSYLSIQELKELYKTAFYSKVNLLLVEPVERSRVVDMEKTWVIDKDHCIIMF